MKCWGGQKTDRRIFADFYNDKKIKETLKTKIITKSIERLIDKGAILGYGVRTPKKWFIKEVKLTKLGRKIWQKWQSRRQKKLL